MTAADVNGDGAIDLGTNLQVLVNEGHGHFTDETATGLPQLPTDAKSWPQRVLIEDVNDDGRPDLTVQFAAKGVVLEADPAAVWLNQGGSFAAPRDRSTASSRNMRPRRLRQRWTARRFLSRVQPAERMPVPLLHHAAGRRAHRANPCSHDAFARKCPAG